MKRMLAAMLGALCASVMSGTGSTVFAFDLTVVSFNVESDADTRSDKVAKDIKRIPASHIWGLVEVDGEDLDEYEAAFGQNYRMIVGKTEASNRRPDDLMAIAYDSTVLEQLGESKELSGAGGSRHPLLAKFRIVETGQKIWFVVNHFQRGLGAPTNEMRQAQASWLNDWAQEKADNKYPPAIVLIGDYNFDASPYTKRGNPAFEIFMSNGMFRWVEPECLSDKSCPLTGTGCNPVYNSILDFVFLAGPARSWKASSEILFGSESEYCANEKTGGADHRPIRAVLTFSSMNLEE